MGAPRGQSRLGVGGLRAPRSPSGRRLDDAFVVED
nr:MAG TPA: hypothetical protein [Caudoviricetes sp.]